MADNIHLEIVTPKQVAYSKAVDSVVISGIEGDMEIFKDHISLITFLKAGKIIAKKCQDNGLIVRAIGDVIALCPPLIINIAEIDELFDILEKSIKYKDKMKCDMICVGHTHCPEANDGAYFNSGWFFYMV